jgi:glycine/D-amino acid oxidase-like deaminating enzyme
VSVTPDLDPSLARVLWWSQLPADLLEPVGAPMDGHVEADVAIVGAGFTGLWTAYYLQQRNPGLRIAIVEKEIAGFGASGRNGGWSSALFPQTDAAIVDRYGLPAARAMRMAMNDSVDEIGRVASHHGWDIGWAKGGTVIAARTASQALDMRVSYRSEHALGLTPNEELLDADSTRARMGATNVVAGTYTPHCAAIQPARLVRSLAREVMTNGAVLFEHSPATSVEPGLVRTAGGSIRARYVVRATEGYTPDVPGHHRTLLPVYSLMVATEPLPRDVWDVIGLEGRPTFSDGRHLVIYGQRTADDRIAFGGRGAPYRFGSRINPESETDDTIHVKLRDTLREMFPILWDYEFTHAWGGALGIARDWWASVGLDPMSGVGWSGGYVGDGVTTANLGGRTLAALITGDHDDPLVSLPWVDHRSRAWEVEPARWIATSLGMRAVSGADRIEARTGRPSLRARIMGNLIGH